MTASASTLHVDLDAFYASVEQLLNPELRGRPVLVGGGVVLAASYEAREFGIHAPMGIRQALARCPSAVVVRGSFSAYQELSEQVFTICEDFTPVVEQISIDEAFLDVRGVCHLLGPPRQIAADLRKRVREETGLNLSVGAANTKFLAKVASATAKPNGLLYIEPGSELEFLHPLPVRAMWGVGPVLEGRLHERGVTTIGELAAISLPNLRAWLGPGAAAHFHALSWNRDPRPVSTTRRAGSVGAQRALGRGTDDLEDLGRILLGLADRVGSRLRAKQRAGRTLTVRVRFPDMSSATRAVTLPHPISSTAALHHAGLPLLEDAAGSRSGRKTLVGISVSNLERFAPLQLELPLEPGDPTRPGSPLGHAHIRVDERVDQARNRFGKKTAGRASLLLADDHGVPDEFRELAERD